MFEFPLEHISYAGIVIALILTGAGLPIPEEVIVIFSGVASNQKVLDPWLAFASCVVGALLGDLATYGIGRHFGRNVLREHPWFARFVTPEREKQIEAMIELHGLKVFFLARFLVGLRSPMYLTAGILRVPFTRFILIDTFCATTVIGVFFSLSYVFADRMHGWWHWIRDAEVDHHGGRRRGSRRGAAVLLRAAPAADGEAEKLSGSSGPKSRRILRHVRDEPESHAETKSVA